MTGGINRLDFQPKEVGRQIATESRTSWKNRANELVFRSCMPGALGYDNQSNTTRSQRLGTIVGEQMFNQGLDAIASGDAFQGMVLAGLGKAIGVVAEIAGDKKISRTLQAEQYGFGEYSKYSATRDTMLAQAGFGNTLGRNETTRNRAFDRTQQSLYSTMMNDLLANYSE